MHRTKCPGRLVLFSQGISEAEQARLENTTNLTTLQSVTYAKVLRFRARDAISLREAGLRDPRTQHPGDPRDGKISSRSTHPSAPGSRKSGQTARTTRPPPKVRMQKSTVFGRWVRFPSGRRFGRVRVRGLRGAPWEELVEMNASGGVHVRTPNTGAEN